MNTNYKTIEFTCGSDLEDAVKKLLKFKEQGILACGSFNGTILYSDTVTLDDAYKTITGKNKTEFDKAQQERIEAIKRQEEEHKQAIPALIKEWMEKGREILTEDRWLYWDKIVPIRLDDLYQGMELGCCLDIVKILNNNGTFEEAKEKIENQNHSGMSFGLVCAMVETFCDRGSEFVKYVR